MCIRRLARCFNKSAIIGVLVGAVLATIYNTTTANNKETHQANANIEAPAAPLSALKKLFEITNCKTKALQTVFKQQGDFWVLYNYVKARREFRCYESVTYATQGDYKFLELLPNLVERWKGPISVAVFATSADFQVTIDSIAYLRNCGMGLIKDYVTFHIYFETKDLPKVNKPLNIIYQDAYNCTLEPPFLIQTSKSENPLTYPINVARNIAIESTQTHFHLAADIDLYPPRLFVPKFLAMVEKREELFRTQTKKVFALPIFEVVETALVPENKTVLRKMLRDGTALLFRSGICPQCHRVIDHDKWLATSESDEGFDVVAVGKRKGLYKKWEPIYVGTRADPPFPEELSAGNQANRMLQAYAMCLLDYSFMVLNDAFLVHKPGVKRKSQMAKQSEMAEREVKLLKGQLVVLLGRRDGCQ